MSRSVPLILYSRAAHPSSSILLSPRTSTKPSYNGTNGYYNGVGPPKDYFSTDPRFSQQSNLPSTLRPGSSRSTTSPNVPHSSLHPQDDIDPVYGWKDQTSLSRVESARPPLPPKIPTQTAQITQMPEPSVPAEDFYLPYPDPSGSNGAGASVYRNDSAGSHVLPSLHYPTGQPANPHTDSPSCKKLVSSKKASSDLRVFGRADIENLTLLSRGPSASTSGYSPSGYSHMNVDRNNSITSTHTGGEPIVVGPSSSVATSLYRGNSTVSRVSSLPQEYMDIKMPVPLEEEYPQEQYHEGEYAEGEDLYTDSEEDESMFVNFALLSHLAVRLRDRVPRGTHVKGSIPYPRAFTGKDIVVSAIESTWNGTARDSCHPPVNHPGSDTARIARKPWNLDERSKSGHRSIPQSPKPALLLRGRVGWQGSDRRCRGRVHVLGRPGGRIRCSDRGGGTPDGRCDLSNQVLYPLLCGRAAVLRVFVSTTGKDIPNPDDTTVYSERPLCVIRDSLCRCLPSRHRLREWCVPRFFSAGSRGTTDLIHPSRASNGRKRFPQRSLPRFPKAKSNAKRTTFSMGEICC